MHNIIAPAKINLFLHIVNKNKLNYHELQSLVTFADFGDVITIAPSKEYKLDISGDFASKIDSDDNLITDAAKNLSKLTGNDMKFHIILKKNIPVGAGLGGGSSDAAAVTKLLLDIWDYKLDHADLSAFLKDLGADVPVCYQQKTAFMEGIGEKVTPVNCNQELYAVLVFPHQHSKTVEVFKNYNSAFSSRIKLSENLNNEYLLKLLGSTKNDLSSSAIALTPSIDQVLRELQITKDCHISRMTGSGSCCFGLFDNSEAAQNAATQISSENPDWWVKKTTLNAS